jgi:hypothetical protein
MHREIKNTGSLLLVLKWIHMNLQTRYATMPAKIFAETYHVTGPCLPLCPLESFYLITHGENIVSSKSSEVVRHDSEKGIRGEIVISGVISVLSWDGDKL